MHVLLSGGTGFIGRHLCRALLRRGHRVTLCSRHPEPVNLPGVKVIQADFSRDHAPADWLPRLAGVDAVINCVGLIAETPDQSFESLHHLAPAALFRACGQRGGLRVIQISALGADSGAASAYHLSKRAADEVLRGLAVDWWVLRPSLVYGRGGQSMEWFGALTALPVLPLPEGGAQALQPVAVEDLVQVILACLEGRVTACQTLDVVGPHAMSLRQMLAALRDWLGEGKLRVVALPPGLVAKLLARRRGGLLNRDSLAMLRRGNTAAVEPLIRESGVNPVALETWLALNPAQTADRWRARLYFLPPLLRLGIALTWLGAGLVSAFFYPTGESYAMLNRVGVADWAAPLALYGASGLDLLLGVAVLARWRPRLIGLGQIGLMTVYTLILSWHWPELWLHPFGPLVKNLPLLAAILALMALEDKK